jgi:hypothetical protein
LGLWITLILLAYFYGGIFREFGIGLLVVVMIIPIGIFVSEVRENQRPRTVELWSKEDGYNKLGEMQTKVLYNHIPRNKNRKEGRSGWKSIFAGYGLLIKILVPMVILAIVGLIFIALAPTGTGPYSSAPDCCGG